jgi:acid phosphatase (class A)
LERGGESLAWLGTVVKTSRRTLFVGVIGAALLAGGGLWWWPHAAFHYLSGQTAEFAAQFTPPPAIDSAAAHSEVAELLDLQFRRTAAEVAAARADRVKDVSRFYAALGLDTAHPPDLPALQKLTDRAEADVGPYVRVVKEKFRRLRPYEIEPKLRPCIGDVKGDLSYPSGHAIYGFLMGYMLAELVPERRAALMQRAEEFARQRMVCGVHFRSDIEAGRHGAYFLFAKLHESPAYREDALRASNELRAALGLASPTPRLQGLRFRLARSRRNA